MFPLCRAARGFDLIVKTKIERLLLHLRCVFNAAIYFRDEVQGHCNVKYAVFN
jgi:hypothetical protein